LAPISLLYIELRYIGATLCIGNLDYLRGEEQAIFLAELGSRSKKDK
jgi:hypothetical protein